MVGKLKAIPGRRSGADDEDARRAVKGHGEEDQLVGGGRDHRGHRSDDASMAGAIAGAWIPNWLPWIMAAKGCYRRRIQASLRLSRGLKQGLCFAGAFQKRLTEPWKEI